jgi:hypothetical protein
MANWEGRKEQCHSERSIGGTGDNDPVPDL